MPDLIKVLKFAAWKLRDYGACEAELCRMTDALTMREAINRLNGGGSDGQDETD